MKDHARELADEARERQKAAELAVRELARESLQWLSEVRGAKPSTSLDREELKPRNVNKHRQVLAAMFAYASRQDAEAFRLLFYTGLRLGEALTLRWEDVDLSGRLLLVRRGLSAGQESLPKGRRRRFVPLSAPAAAAISRLAGRPELTGPDDYLSRAADRFVVLAGRLASMCAVAVPACGARDAPSLYQPTRPARP